MNEYINKFRNLLPLLNHCEGPGTMEDGIIRHLLDILDLKSNYFVEFGQRTLGRGTLGRIAREKEGGLLVIDSRAIKEEKIYPWNNSTEWTSRRCLVTPFNINNIFDECCVPEMPSACVIDVDGMDYWCMLAILQKRRPSLLICEYNCHIDLDIEATLAYNENHTYSHGKDYGASLLALKQLAERHSYRLVHIHGPLNAYFVAEELVDWNGFNETLSFERIKEQGISSISSTEMFYDSFHTGERPSWYGRKDPEPEKPPWFRLDQIGEEVEIVRIDELMIAVYARDTGGSHYKLRSHKEESVSPIWRLIRHSLKPNVLIDIGANYGHTAAMLSSRLAVQRIYAVEPDPRLAELIRDNLRQVGDRCDIRLIQAAISSCNEPVTLLGINPHSTQDNRVVKPKNWQEVVAPVISLDKIIAEVPLSSSMFIKSDTQGFDINVIRSGYRELTSRKKWMLRCEFAPDWIKSQGFDTVMELEWLCSSFRVFEAPLRTTWNARLNEVLNKTIEASQAYSFTEYVRSLNHNGKGWVDLYVLPDDCTCW
ncbi:FkbM family methyltransferase [Synechococcus sp. A10-1-5-1]|uniref:FkbM family methyltransferase n=1 Tax=Synechococcus sp. A10-1-5-1 TaxID=2936507 RepID=UPI0020015CE6|nr:FkbM family methyltransferase [Synechococcus sp. A10-1-5-1]UPM49176.1 FkbM family methyltransferase [Synechococcus sp. A10-1-5-1]